DDPAEDGNPAGTERLGRLLHLPVELEQHWLNGADDEGERHEEQRQHQPRSLKGDIHAEGAVWPVELQKNESSHDRGQGERQVDDRIEEPLAAERVTNENPGDRGTRDGVERGNE